MGWGERIFTFVSLVILLMGAWYFVWEGRAEKARVQFTGIIEEHEQRFRRADAGFSLSYKILAKRGYPSDVEIVMVQPVFVLERAGERFEVSASQLSFRRVSEQPLQYKMNTPQWVYATYRTATADEKYRVAVSPTMEVSLVALAEAPGQLRRYRVELPQSIILQAELNGTSQPIRFDFANRLPHEAAIPSSLSYPIAIFVGMLREALVYRTPQRTQGFDLKRL